MTAKLTMGPILFHWDADKKRDFYYKIADETAIDTVYIGEVICSKRAPFFEKHYPDIIERLHAGGKKVVISTLSEVMIKHDRKMVDSACQMDDIEIEANDASALYHLVGRKHRIGQLLNVYSEDTLRFLASKGATHVCLTTELPADSLAVLGKAANDLEVHLECQIFGRMSLALSARCYHARAHGKIKDNCQFVCGEDDDGLDLKTLDGKNFLSINGIQTLSYTYLNLLHEMESLQDMGIEYFRISPHSFDIVKTTKIIQDTLNKKITPEEGVVRLKNLGIDAPFSNGFFYKKSGFAWTHDVSKIA